LILDQSTLTFTKSEIASLFGTHYDMELTSEELDSLLEYTEGWAIGLQLIWQSIRSQSPLTLQFPLQWQANSLETLFQMLAHEVFERQPADVREFLLVTATLRDLHPDVCDRLLESAGHPSNDSASMLAYLRRQDLFVVETAEGTLRYHHIFHNFLKQQSPPDKSQEWDRAAAQYFLGHRELVVRARARMLAARSAFRRALHWRRSFGVRSGRCPRGRHRIHPRHSRGGNHGGHATQAAGIRLRCGHCL
jgi:ATP/maltotriose-dependent transcriptional regulator MalT